MKKFYAAILLLFVSIGAYAQCTPDNTFTQVGYSPNVLDTAFVGQNYDMVVHIRIPKDTTVTILGQTVVADIDSIRLVDVVGLPPNFTYQCNVASCVFTPTQTYCAKMSGTANANDIGTHPLRFAVVAYASAVILGTPTNFPPQPDTLDQFSLTVANQGGINAVNEFESNKAFRIYPNPAQKQFNILLNGNAGETISYEIADITGKIFTKESIILRNASDVLPISSENWATGIYFIRVQNTKGLFTQRLVIEN
jgi:hypothetical protein